MRAAGTAYRPPLPVPILLVIILFSLILKFIPEIIFHLYVIKLKKKIFDQLNFLLFKAEGLRSMAYRQYAICNIEHLFV